jgi:NTP pyrophosphatase (non-canonical NTP hydrolase)
MNWQQKSAEFAKTHNLIHDPGVHLIDLYSELGEVAKEWLLATGYGRHVAEARPNLHSELGDVLYSLCLVAESAEIDLDAALADTLNKFAYRFAQKGTIGSE